MASPSQTPPPLIVAVVGPTATGKSALAIALARRLGAEIVNADAMQLYRGMDIGTAKLLRAQWGGVPHHVFDIWQVDQPASVAEYQRISRATIDRIHAEGKRVVVVGGSGLYVRAALDRMEFPGTDAAIREKLTKELAALDSFELHRRLAERDPAAALAILPSNGRRIVRALEVIELTGRPFAASMAQLAPFYDTHYLGLDLPTPQLDGLVNARVTTMWRQGLVSEVKALLAEGLAGGVTARRALGYAQVLTMLSGELTEEEAILVTQQATRRFVRRQRSWFRRDSRVCWLDAASDSLMDDALKTMPSSSTSNL